MERFLIVVIKNEADYFLQVPRGCLAFLDKKLKLLLSRIYSSKLVIETLHTYFEQTVLSDLKLIEIRSVGASLPQEEQLQDAFRQGLLSRIQQAHVAQRELSMPNNFFRGFSSSYSLGRLPPH